MKLKIFILIVALHTTQVIGNIKAFLTDFSSFNGLSFLRLGACDSTKCASYPVHYQELGCKPIVKDGECCPSSFDCKHLDTKDPSKCYFKGKSYGTDERINRDDLKGSCIGAVHCSEGPRFIYAHKDCLEFFGPPIQPGCIRIYSPDQCCSVGTVCGDEAKKLSTCEFEGKTYKEGERMYPVDYKCHRCFCTKDFENKPITENSNCYQTSCNLEILEADNIKNKCVPVYHPDSCCPYNWVCPKKTDAIIPAEHKDSSGLKCKFGDLEFSIGDVLSTGENNCSKCSCKIPPMLDCVFTPGC